MSSEEDEMLDQYFQICWRIWQQCEADNSWPWDENLESDQSD